MGEDSPSLTTYQRDKVNTDQTLAVLLAEAVVEK